jgi:hypothetical protein
MAAADDDDIEVHGGGVAKKPRRRKQDQNCAWSRSEIRLGPVGFQFSHFCVSALEAGMSNAANWANQFRVFIVWR